MRPMAVLVIACTLAAAPTPVRAEVELDPELIAQIAKGAFHRTRRAIAIGPEVGVYGGGTLSPSDAVNGFAFGVALYTFDIPTVFELQQLIARRIEVRVKDRIKEMLASGQTQIDQEALVREVVADIKNELAGGPIERRTFERPRYGVVIEALRQRAPVEAWGSRVSVTKGLEHVSVGLAASVLRGGGNTTVLLGPDLSVRLTPIGTGWTPVLDLYVRGDYAFDADDFFVVTVGGRALLDLF